MKQTSPNEVSTDNPTGSARAIEVVTMLGDAVVGVEHLEPHRPKLSRRTTLALYLAGALMLAVSAVAFARGVSNAADNRAAYDRMVEIDRVAAHHFRPEQLSLGWDVLAFGGLVGGLAAIGFGLWRARSRPVRTELTAGTAADADVTLAAVVAERFPLVRATPERTVLTVAPGMDARLRAGGQAAVLADLIAGGQAVPAAGLAGGYELALPEGGSARLSAGPATFVVRSVPAPAGSVGALTAAVDRRAVGFLAGSAVAHAIALLMLAWVPPTSKSLALDLGSGETRPTIIEWKPAVDEFDEQPIDDGDDMGEETAGAGGMAGEEGLAGNESPAATGVNRVAKRAETASLTRATAIEMARREGILGTDMAAEFRSLIGSGPLTSGWDNIDSYGGGGDDGNGAGDFGGGNKGNGPGGGGNRDDVYRIGNDDLWKPLGPGDGGDNVFRLRQHKGDKPKPVISFGEPTGPDKETIRRYIRRHLDRIRYLYEKQLLVDPALSGTVIVVFTISPEGVVIAAKGKGMNGHVLEVQIAEVFKSIAFPRTSNGGVIAVSYPINLRSRV